MGFFWWKNFVLLGFARDSRAVWSAAPEANSLLTRPIFMRYRKNESIFQVDHKYAYYDNIWNSNMRNNQQRKLKSGCTN